MAMGEVKAFPGPRGGGAEVPTAVSEARSGQSQVPGYSTNEEWNAKLAQVAQLLEALEKIDDAETTRAVFAALQAIDAVHREALHRLVRLFKDGVLEQVITDPAIHTLMGMYDLLPPASPACQKVWDFISDDASPPASIGVPGQPEEGTLQPDPAAVVAHWSPVPPGGVPRDGEATLCHLEEGEILLVAAHGQLYALDAICPQHATSMAAGRLDDHAWICPNGPACVYDIRDGRRTGADVVVACYPLKRDGHGRILLGFGIPFEPRRPAF